MTASKQEQDRIYHRYMKCGPDTFGGAETRYKRADRIYIHVSAAKINNVNNPLEIVVTIAMWWHQNNIRRDAR